MNFIHDEVLIEVPTSEDATQHLNTVQRLMIEGMRAVVPDVRIKVEGRVAETSAK